MSQQPVRRTENEAKETNAPELKLVTGGNRAPKPPFRVILLCLLFGFVSLGVALYLSHQRTNPWNQSLHSFFSLQETYAKDGLETFIAQKESLKHAVEHTLKESHDEGMLREARNVAVYLFPELLDDSDFEKSTAITQWASLEHSIEQRPTDPQSRFLFEDLKAGIWNYENPERSQPRISRIAQQVIRIYDALSTPQG